MTSRLPIDKLLKHPTFSTFNILLGICETSPNEHLSSTERKKIITDFYDILYIVNNIEKSGNDIFETSTIIQSKISCYNSLIQSHILNSVIEVSEKKDRLKGITSELERLCVCLKQDILDYEEYKTTYFELLNRNNSEIFNQICNIDDPLEKKRQLEEYWKQVKSELQTHHNDLETLEPQYNLQKELELVNTEITRTYSETYDYESFENKCQSLTHPLEKIEYINSEILSFSLKIESYTNSPTNDKNNVTVLSYLQQKLKYEESRLDMICQYPHLNSKNFIPIKGDIVGRTTKINYSQLIKDEKLFETLEQKLYFDKLIDENYNFTYNPVGKAKYGQQEMARLVIILIKMNNLFYEYYIHPQNGRKKIEQRHVIVFFQNRYNIKNLGNGIKSLNKLPEDKIELMDSRLLPYIRHISTRHI